MLKTRKVSDFELFRELGVFVIWGFKSKSEQNILLYFIEVLHTNLKIMLYTSSNNFVHEAMLYGIEISSCGSYLCSKYI